MNEELPALPTTRAVRISPEAAEALEQISAAVGIAKGSCVSNLILESLTDSAPFVALIRERTKKAS